MPPMILLTSPPPIPPRLTPQVAAVPAPPTTLDIRTDPLAALFVAYSLSLVLEDQGDPAAATAALARVNDQVETEASPDCTEAE